MFSDTDQKLSSISNKKKDNLHLIFPKKCKKTQAKNVYSPSFFYRSSLFYYYFGGQSETVKQNKKSKINTKRAHMHTQINAHKLLK